MKEISNNTLKCKINLLLLTVSLVASIGISELVLRYFFEDYLVLYEEERSLLYRYDEELGWFPRVNSNNSFTGSRTISVTHNSRGFRDKEHEIGRKPGMIFLGDSFVWGYDAEQEERFTEKLRSRISGWEIYNLGVSGYSTDQEYLLLRHQIDYYKPRLVFLMFLSENDDYDNTTNSIGNGAYYKPYFKMHDQRIELNGVPVPTSLSYFARQHPLLARIYVVRLLVKAASPRIVRSVISPTAAIILEMNDYVYQRGSHLVVGIVGPHPSLEYFMNHRNISYVKLEGAERYNDMGKHWTPAGHITVSNKIHDYLHTAGLLDPEKEGSRK